MSLDYVSLNIDVKVDTFVNSCDVFSSNLLIIALSDLHFSLNLASTIKQNLIPLETMQTRPQQKICLHLEKLGKSTQWTEPPRNSETNLVKPGTNLRSGSLDTDWVKSIVWLHRHGIGRVYTPNHDKIDTSKRGEEMETSKDFRLGGAFQMCFFGMHYFYRWDSLTHREASPSGVSSSNWSC